MDGADDETDEATVDDEGAFAFDALPPDTYTLSAPPGAEQRVAAPAGERDFERREVGDLVPVPGG